VAHLRPNRRRRVPGRGGRRRAALGAGLGGDAACGERRHRTEARVRGGHPLRVSTGLVGGLGSAERVR